MMLQSATLNSGLHGIKDPGLWEGDRIDRIPDATCQKKKKKASQGLIVGGYRPSDFLDFFLRLFLLVRQLHLRI